MNRKLFLIPLSTFVLASCNSTSPTIVIKDKTPLETPIISVSEEGVIECNAIDNASSYIVEVLNENTNKVKRNEVLSFPYAIVFTESGVYSVRVAALPDADSIYNQSLFSDYVQVLSPIKDNLSSPKNIKVINNNKITFDKVANAKTYQIMIDDDLFETKDNYLSYAFLPGTNYKIKAKACIEENIFLSSSPWSSEVNFKYNVTFSKPTGLSISNLGLLTWSCSAYSSTTGFTVKAVNRSNNKITTISSMTSQAHLSSLDEGTYDVSVMANGIGDNPGSSYSTTVAIKLENASYWYGSNIASNFVGFNDTTGTYVDSENVTSMRSYQGWGGLMTPAFSVDFTKNPILRIDYKEIKYGYMGAYYYGETYNVGSPTFWYQNDIYLDHSASNVELVYDMKKNSGGADQSEASGLVNSLRVSIGFTNAGGSSNPNREVSKLRSVKILYITVL